MEDELARVVARNARRRRGDRTQDAVANRARGRRPRLVRAIVAAIETGQRRLDLREATLFAGALGAEVSDLVAGSKWERIYRRPGQVSDESRGDAGTAAGPQPVPPVVAAANNEAERRAAAKLGGGTGAGECGGVPVVGPIADGRTRRPGRSPGTNRPRTAKV